MSRELMVRSRFFDYKVSFVDATVQLPSILQEGDVLVVDDQVASAHAHRLRTIMDRWTTVPVSASEQAKSFESVGETLNEVVRAGFRRNSRLVAIGGGVTQDIVAFMATTLYRGVDWLFVPTTLLGQGDSCIGGKSSINFRGFKNLLGSFLPPRRILVDVSFLDTLPADQIASGIGEILHFLIFQGEEEFAFLERHLDTIRSDRSLMEELAARSLTIKKAVIERDEFDRGERQLFNYGHSFGHAIEAVTDYGIPHGVAVSMGIDIANFVSVGLGHAAGDFRDRVRVVASTLWPGYSIRDLDLDALFAALRRDKKNIGNDVYVILAAGFGGLFKTKIELAGAAGGLIEEYLRTEAP